MRVISPSASRFRSVSVRTFGEISGMAFPMALNRVAGFSASMHRMSIAHFPEKREITFLTGHDDVQVYFLDFLSEASCSLSIMVTLMEVTYDIVTSCLIGE